MYNTKLAAQPHARKQLPIASRADQALVVEVERAIERKQLALHYQPKVDVRGGEIVGVEALVRWAHPERGLVMPDDFIPVIERTDLIVPFTEHVLEQALDQCAQWHADGLRLGVAVNVSARNVQDPNFPTAVASALHKWSVDGEWVELEMTEIALLADRERAVGVLQGLHGLGVSLAIDDFGTGHSSLVNLRDLPFDRLKIDGMFVAGMRRQVDEIIVASTIELASRLGVTSIAEGVEDEIAWRRLRTLGCDVAQGYWIARPAPADVVTRWTRRRSAA